MPVLTSSIINSAEIKDKIYYIWDDMVKGFALKVNQELILASGIDFMVKNYIGIYYPELFDMV